MAMSTVRCPSVGVGDADPLRRRPDQLVDLVHLPQLVAVAELRPGGDDEITALLGVVPAHHPTLDRSGHEARGDVGIRRVVGETAGIGPDGILEHADSDLLVGDHAEVLGCVQLPGVGILRFEDLGVLVVRHRLGGVDLAFEQADHVELLLDERDVVRRVETGLGQGGEDLVLVAESPVADVAPFEVLRTRDARVDERDLQGARALEDLGDVDDVRAGLSRVARALGTQARAKSTLPSARSCCGTMSTPVSMISTSRQ